MSIIRHRTKNGSFSFMSLEYACEILAHLVKYNFIYGTFSTSMPVLYILFCGYHFMWILDDFGNMLNMKVVKDLCN